MVPPPSPPFERACQCDSSNPSADCKKEEGPLGEISFSKEKTNRCSGRGKEKMETGERKWQAVPSGASCD